MLALYLFNLTGYPLLFNFLMQRASSKLIAQLDESRYDESQLLEIKVPLHSQYIIGNNHYERFDGEAEVNGVKYTYVKRKFFHDTLYVKYLPDNAGTRLLSAKNDYAKHSGDHPSEKKQGSSKKGGPSVQHNNKVAVYTFSIIAASNQQEKTFLAAALRQSLIIPQEQPPDLIA